MSSNVADFDAESQAYAKELGKELRKVRRSLDLTLEEVDRLSGREFKDSALSAYERGDRMISVLRLQRLALFYKVPVDSLLPKIQATSDQVPDTARQFQSPEELMDWVGRQHSAIEGAIANFYQYFTSLYRTGSEV